MPSIRISRENTSGTYFTTMTVRNWHYVLDRHSRWNILADSLKWFQENKDLKLYAFVFMINHIHLITKTDDTIEFVRDFKKFTARNILANMKNREPDLLKLFKSVGTGYEFWSKTNMPELIESDQFMVQKVNYIHQNPVKKIYVARPEDWSWSSANADCELKTDR